MCFKFYLFILYFGFTGSSASGGSSLVVVGGLLIARLLLLPGVALGTWAAGLCACGSAVAASGARARGQ